MKRILIIIFSIILLAGICGGIYYFCNYDSNLVNPDEVETDSEYVNITYDQNEDIIQEDVLGILTIEKIGLKAVVKEGSNNEVLKEYIGHIENTSIYDGNVGLAAHNRGNKYSYFARINELEKGDCITYQTKFYTRKYQVDNIDIPPKPLYISQNGFSHCRLQCDIRRKSTSPFYPKPAH